MLLDTIFLFYIQKYQGPRWINTALKSYVVRSIYDIQNKAVNSYFKRVVYKATTNQHSKENAEMVGKT